MGYDNFLRFIEYLRTIQTMDDNDVFLAVTGRKGSGKSSFAVGVARKYVEKYFKIPFNIKTYIAYNNQEIIDKIYTLPKYSPLIADEAVRFAWSRDWNKAENRELTRLSAQIRTKKLLFFMCIPKISWIDPAYRNGMIDVWAWIHSTVSEDGKKAHCLLFESDQNQAETDSWHLDILKKHSKKKRKTIGRFTNLDKIHTLVKHHPCYMDFFEFPKLPEELYTRYLKIRDSKAFERSGEYVSQKDTSKIATYNIKEKWLDLVDEVNKTKFKQPTYQLLANKVFRDPRTRTKLVSDATLKLWVSDLKKTLYSKKVEEQLKLEKEGPQEIHEEFDTEILQEKPLDYEENYQEEDDGI